METSAQMQQQKYFSQNLPFIKAIGRKEDRASGKLSMGV